MSSARRPLLTATAAATLLGALWFVPSANATSDSPVRDAVAASPSPQVAEQARIAATTAGDTVTGTRLADTGSFDSTPYVLGGTLFLTLGAGFVAYSVRRERLGF
ncbi:LPXTG cell wall anchor domain-containing protein [Streptomyces coeruleorubidus]|uniref:LPXTG cell wall anchor domain-containing protein n=1 Tax=Streptomyces coeruleorubidus TaxID=116188 RepID=UPI00237EECD8|nr:LPXTG cell wall anchor domain-containing protein [Streptomyces coeruleorubidus]WDV54108.1 LPXTG cell wall anchor domain-containing protein [Streptomyces coeruleorubidus]